MSDGREEREEQKRRAEEEKKRDPADALDPDELIDGWQPERPDS